MAVHTNHPVSAPPSAPIRETTGHLLLRGWCIFVLFSALAASFWVNLIGSWGMAGLLGGGTLSTIVIWAIVRPPVQWRRLPWFAICYIAWAGLSILWSQWPDATALTWLVLAATTVNGLFIAAALTWRELLRALTTALRWCLALSLGFELWVSLVIQHQVVSRPGNANLLAALAVLAIIVFSARLVDRPIRRGWQAAWIVLAIVLLWRSASATMLLAVAAVGVVLVTVLLMRSARGPGRRTKFYLGYAVVAVGGAGAVWLLRDRLAALLGRPADLTGRTGIWEAVLERAAQRPAAGFGYMTPWLPRHPMIEDWITVDGLPVLQAHNMWIDVFLQLGVIGVILLALTYLAFVWRAWFFAVDRPRWDLVADRPYQAVTLVPTLVATELLVQGLSDSRPLMEWGWMLLVMFAFKIKQAPLLGRGASEQRLIGEQGETTRAVQ